MIDTARGSTRNLPYPARRARAASLAEQQAAFAMALLDPQQPLPTGLQGPDGQPSARRFALYRNNVVVGLVETLKAAYPVILRLVGEEFFAAMARMYVRAEPPASPIMLDYGAGFPRFIGQFEPAAALPYLQDVARLERGWVEAYHAADASPLPLSAFGRIPPEDIPRLRLVLHPSARIARSVFPIVEIWQANVDGNGSLSIDLDDGGDALVARPDMEVEVRRLPEGAAAFIEALRAGASIVDAAAEGHSASSRFDLAGTLRGVVEAGIIVGHDSAPTGSLEEA